VRQFIEEEMERIIKGTCQIAASTYEFRFEKGYPAVVNHAKETEFLVACAQLVPEVQIIEESEPHMGGEDFAYYLQKVPGTFFFTGARPQGAGPTYPHHHPKFDIDERAMLIAAQTLGTAAIQIHKED
jgi:metal-dependent amidase/aminoacylase/carboxypeptidase family protein